MDQRNALQCAHADDGDDDDDGAKGYNMGSSQQDIRNAGVQRDPHTERKTKPTPDDDDDDEKQEKRRKLCFSFSVCKISERFSPNFPPHIAHQFFRYTNGALCCG